LEEMAVNGLSANNASVSNLHVKALEQGN
jgi:hypothetical protein